MNRDNDDTFTSLLSNQRKLLMQIQQEINVAGARPSEARHPYEQEMQRATLSNFITSTMSGASSQSTAMHPVSSMISHYRPGSESAFRIVNSQRPHLPPHYQQQDSLSSSVSSPMPSQSQSLPPPLPPSQMATSRPQPSSTSISSRSFTNDLLQDYMLEPTPLRMKRLSLSLGFSSSDDLNDFLEESSFLRGSESRRGSVKLTGANQNTHDHHTMHDDLSRIQASQGLFDTDSDSPGDSSFSHLFDELKPRHSSPKDKDNDNTTTSSVRKKKEGRNDRRQNKRRKKNHHPGDSKDSKETKRKEENTTYQPNINTNRKISSEVQKLADALEKSAQSQQDIHLWDRKMGLKRSHSKTMTQSMQSRKRLRGCLHKISEVVKKPT
ncbi:unnamed protein product [Cylindrotheca closterium]|uniref:Uncharacterized protein n=1 Tax=Cylindrotheca closterium TaxID=2856 RepID=A0AAD2PX53_9STRA|nr:unnamed protein product [Cylindrotheca closterium]